MEREKSGRTRIKTSGEKQKSDRQCGRGMMAASPRLFFSRPAYRKRKGLDVPERRDAGITLTRLLTFRETGSAAAANQSRRR